MLSSGAGAPHVDAGDAPGPGRCGACRTYGIHGARTILDLSSSLATLRPVLAEPLSPPAAKALILDILANGQFAFSNHALEEMGKEDPDITEEEAFSVLRGGVVEPAELRSGSWRYRVRSRGIYVVLAFRSETRAKIVTAWRTRR